MATGVIKRLDQERGYGFIRPAGASEDVFFHSSALQGLVFDQLSEGRTVEFEKEPDDRDPRRSRAVNVRATAEAGPTGEHAAAIQDID
jgi:cold shock protein